MTVEELIRQKENIKRVLLPEDRDITDLFFEKAFSMLDRGEATLLAERFLKELLTHIKEEA